MLWIVCDRSQHHPTIKWILLSKPVTIGSNLKILNHRQLQFDHLRMLWWPFIVSGNVFRGLDVKSNGGIREASLNVTVWRCTSERMSDVIHRTNSCSVTITISCRIRAPVRMLILAVREWDVYFVLHWLCYSEPIVLSNVRPWLQNISLHGTTRARQSGQYQW